MYLEYCPHANKRFLRQASNGAAHAKCTACGREFVLLPLVNEPDTFKVIQLVTAEDVKRSQEAWDIFTHMV